MRSLVLLFSCVVLASANVWNASLDITAIPGGFSGSGKTTHYWDCCVPACSFPPDRSIVTHGVVYCLQDGTSEVWDYTGTSECYAPPGTTYTCNDNQPWIINQNLAYGFVAASFQGGIETDHCCQCVLLSFQGALEGKHYLAQITNTGSDLGTNHFDIQIPGGGVGIFNGCQRQWNTGPDGWGQRYGGVTSEAECGELPGVLQQGCRFRWEFLQGVEDPDVTFQQVECPQELTGRTGCKNVRDP